MFDVITIGAATRDVFLESRNFQFITSREFTGGVGECLALGSKNEVHNIFFSTGGGATNAAITFGQLGLRASAMIRVGKDSAGEEIVKVLEQAKVNTKFVQYDPKKNTAYSTLLMYGPGERTVLVYRGPSNHIVVSKENLERFHTKWLYVTSVGGRLDVLAKLWSFAKKKNIKIAWNPGSEELKIGLVKLLPFIHQCAVFNVNKEEASHVTGCDNDMSSPSKKERELACIFKNLCGKAEITVITDGGHGAYACKNKKIWFVHSLGTKPRNTTGAGDAFGSGFVAGLILQNSIEYALRLGTLNADSVIRTMGAKTGILKKLPTNNKLAHIKIEII